MNRFAVVVSLVAGSVAQAELIEYSVSGSGVILYEANDSNSTPHALGGRSWNAGFESAVDSSYAFRFYADTDIVVSDGHGGYSVLIEAFHYALGDGSVGAVSEQFAFHVAADGSASFEALDWIQTDTMVAREAFSLVSRGLLAGYDPGAELATVQTILDVQNYNSGNVLAIFDAANGAAGFTMTSIGFGARYVDSIPSVPASGVLSVVGIGGLVAMRRRC